MNPKYIRYIIILMALAMTGLIGVQIFWIRQSVEQRNQQFSQGTFEAISNAVYEYEKRKISENLKKIFEKENYKRIINKQLDSLDKVARTELNQEGPVPDYPAKINRPIKPGGDIPIDGSYGSGNFFPEFDEDSNANFQSKLKETYKMMNKKSDMVNKMFNDFLSGMVVEGPSQLDSVLLDSLISKELKDRGLNIKYELGVYNLYQRRFLFKKTKDPAKLLDSQFKVPMSAMDPFYNENFLVVYFPYKTEYLLRSLVGMLIASAILLFIIIFSFGYTVNTIFKQKKVSEIKNDLINNITHELKTPISTISLACQAINDPDILKSEAIVKNYINMIREENSRLGLLVENVLQTAVFERGDYKLKIRKVDLHQKFERVLTSLSIQAQNKNITIIKKLQATHYIVEADEVMLTNLVYNLLDNAIKYSSGQEPFVEVVTRDIGPDRICFEIADNGIGISREDQKRVFEKLYRVPTGNVHNVKGFGLGLSYVKSIVERHKGTIRIDSALGEGSRFIVELPLNQAVEH